MTTALRRLDEAHKAADLPHALRANLSLHRAIVDRRRTARQEQHEEDVDRQGVGCPPAQPYTDAILTGKDNYTMEIDIE